ncbi:MAG TPA: glycosyltransferase family 39 protein, partial [Isosphaeraceae bacterium]
MGLAWTLLLNGMLGVGAYWGARDGLRQPAGSARVLGAATLAWAWATLGMEVLGCLGWLARGPLAAWAGAGLLAGLAVRLRRQPGPPRPEPGPAAGGGWGPAATLAVGLVLANATVLGLRSLLGPVKVVSDGPIYHLYFAARWWKAGRLFLIATPFGESAAPYFPAVGDLGFAWLLIGWGGDRLAKVGQAPFLPLAALASYALARRLGVGRPAAVVAACWSVSSTPLLLFSFEPNVDTIFVAGYLIACVFFLRYALGDDGAGSLALGALAAGGAWGTKPTGVVFVPPLLALAALAVVLRPAPGRDRLRHGALLVALPLVMAGFWPARNAWLTGNPLYPLDVPALGLTGWHGPEAMRRSPYFIARGDGRALIDILLAVLDPRQAPLWLAALAGAWVRRGEDRALRRWVWGCSALAVADVALYWLLIPYRTQQRFMLQALGLAAVPLGRLLDRGPALRGLGVVLLAVHLLTGQAWPWGTHEAEIPWDLDPRIPNASPPPGLGIGGIGARAVLVLGAIGVAAAWGRLARWPTPGRAAPAAVAAAALLGGWAVASDPGLRGARVERFFPPFPDYYLGWLRLDAYAGAAGTRVAYAGTDLPYYLMGRGLRNEVRAVPVDAHRGWL